MPDINERRRGNLSGVMQGFLHRVIGRVEAMFITTRHDENTGGAGAQAHDEYIADTRT